MTYTTVADNELIPLFLISFIVFWIDNYKKDNSITEAVYIHISGGDINRVWPS